MRGRLPDPAYEEQAATHEKALVSQPRPSGLKIRRRYARVYCHADEVQPACPCLAVEFKREQKVRQLGLRVGRPGSVASLALQVVETDPALFMGHAAHRDDPGSRPRHQPGQKQAREGEVPEMIGAELQLESILGCEPLRHAHHPGAVHEQVQGAGSVQDLRCEAVD